MNTKIKILSNTYLSEQLFALLNNQDLNQTSIALELQKTAQGNRDIDPNILAAIITSGTLFITTVLTLIVNSLIKAHEKTNNKQNSYIEIKKKDGSWIKLSSHYLTEGEIRKLVSEYELNELKSIDSIAHLAE